MIAVEYTIVLGDCSIDIIVTPTRVFCLFISNEQGVSDTQPRNLIHCDIVNLKAAVTCSW